MTTRGPEQVDDIFVNLTAIEQEVVSYRFGFVDGKLHGVAEAASYLKLSQSDLRAIEQRAMRKLRHPKPIEPQCS